MDQTDRRKLPEKSSSGCFGDVRLRSRQGIPFDTSAMDPSPGLRDAPDLDDRQLRVGTVEVHSEHFLLSWGVKHILSPPRRPQYNGGIEASNRWMKVGTEQEAEAAGRAGGWRTWTERG